MSLASEFRPYHSSIDDTRLLCDFTYPRVQVIYRNQCVPRDSIRPILDFEKFAETLKPCDGSLINTPGPYYTAKNNVIPDIAVCPTCYEVLLHYTIFDNRFESVPDGTLGGTVGWMCDMATPFFQRLLDNCLKTEVPDFALFAREANARFAIPECPGEGKPVTEFSKDLPGTLFSARNGRSGNICSACYKDVLSETSLSNAFVPAQLTRDQQGTITCDLASEYSKKAMGFAIKKSDHEVWRSSVAMMEKVGPCPGIYGIDGEQFAKEKARIGSVADWYQLNQAPSIQICNRCYWLKVKLLGADRHFSRMNGAIPMGIVRQCYLTESNTPESTSSDSHDNFENSMAWRGRRIFNSMIPGHEAGDWSVLSAVAKEITRLPPPCGGQNRGFKRPSQRKWFGRLNPNSANLDDCTLAFCEECHSRTVKGTPYEAHYSSDLTEAAYNIEGTTGFTCQTYTNRARGFLKEAAQSGKLVQFARLWNQRTELRDKRDAWKPLVAAQLAKTKMANDQQSLQLMEKANAQFCAMANISSANMGELAGETGERWGNSKVCLPGKPRAAR
jgi:hypothetical protein